MHRLAAYEPECVLVLTGPALDSSSRQVVIAGLHEIAAAATDAGVRLGLEPAHPSQHQSVSFLNWISDTLALLDDADLPQVGLMADTYNLWGERPEALAAIADRVTGLHVADVPREPERTDRVLPGEGGVRSAEHVAALRDTGWDGYLDVEIFSTPTASGRFRSTRPRVAHTLPPRGSESDRAVEHEHDADELLRIVEEPALANGPRTLIPPGECEPAIPVELVELPSQITHARAHVALVVPRRGCAEEHGVDELPRLREELHDADGAHVRDDILLEA